MDTSEIIGIVAKRHGIRLAPEDPIFAITTVLEAVTDELGDHLDGIVTKTADQAAFRLDAAVEKASEAVRAEIEISQRAVEGLLNAAGAWSAERMRASAAESAKAMEEAVTRLLMSAESASRTADAARRVALWSASGAVCLCILILAAAFGFWLGGR